MVVSPLRLGAGPDGRGQRQGLHRPGRVPRHGRRDGGPAGGHGPGLGHDAGHGTPRPQPIHGALPGLRSLRPARALPVEQPNEG